MKVCCIENEAALRAAVAAGADAVGLVGPMPSGTGIIGLDRAQVLARAVPPGVASVLLSSALTAADLVAEASHVRCDVIQIVDRVPLAAYAALRLALPALKLVQVVHVESGAPIAEAPLAEAIAAAGHVDALLLDSGSRAGPVARLGGTGEVHDWAISARIVEAVPVPVWLAGGLTPLNVGEAIATVRPFGVDVCTGLRTDGRLDEEKLAAFAGAVRGAAA